MTGISGVRLDEVGPQVVTITQPGHGFVLPSFGFIPAVYNAVTGDYEGARADDITTAADVFVTRVLDANTFEIQEDAFLCVPSHGLTVGKWYVTSSTVAGDIDPYDAVTGSEAPIQYLAFPVDADNILLRMDPVYTQPFIPQDIAILDEWTMGADPVLSAGEDRILVVGVDWEDQVGSTLINSIEVGGVTGTLLVEQSIISGLQFGASYYYWTDAEIETMVGSTITLNWTAGAPTAFEESTVMLQFVDQVTPIVAVNSDSGTGGTDTLNANVNTVAGGYAFQNCGGGNPGMTFTNQGVGWVRKINSIIASADGVIDDKIITADATPELVEMDIAGSNRHTLVAASFRRRES